MKSEHPAQGRRQSNWDGRAAANFIGGGSGCGLLLCAALLAASGPVYTALACAALGLIALGLFCVWMEIGRPWRAMNVFLHVRTSWMTREALAAPPLFVFAALAVWSGAAPWVWLSALPAFSFLYCQARIVRAAKGIPAWRASRIVPLFMATGVAEGAGLLILALAWYGDPALLSRAALLLLGLTVLRAWCWVAYRKQLKAQGAADNALQVLESTVLPFLQIGHGLTIALLVLILPGMPLAGDAWLAATAGLLATAGGYWLKYVIVVRASFHQAYALPRLPVRGRGVRREAASAATATTAGGTPG